jgi:hypothetical protein
MLQLTDKEKGELRQAIMTTYYAIGDDVDNGYRECGEKVPTGEKYQAVMAECIFDADRVQSYGKLTPELMQKVRLAEYKDLLKFLKDEKIRF